MVKVMKSPNMMSTTGRNPVMAAPTARPVKPASEIGVSSTRSLPNSSNRPERTLKGVPASATSSPRIKTLGSRRISSASASRIACANVNSRSPVSGIHVLAHFIDGRVRRRDGELDGFFHLRLDFFLYAIEQVLAGEFLFQQQLSKANDRVPLGLPGLFLLLRSVVLAIDISNVMAMVAIGIAEQKGGPFAAPRAVHQNLRKAVHGGHILPIHRDRFDIEGSGPRQDFPRGGFGIVRVFGIEIVLADVDYGQLKKLSEVHYLVQEALPESAFSEEADRHLVRTQLMGRERGTGGDASAAAYDRIRSQVAGRRVGNVHGTSFALAVAGLLSQQFGEHSIGGGAFRQTMSVAAMGAGDVVAL